MVRVGGMSYRCEPGAKMGEGIQDMRLKGKPVEADKNYKVASWAPVLEASKNAGPPVWEVVETYLAAHKVLKPRRLNVPGLMGTAGNSGVA